MSGKNEDATVKGVSDELEEGTVAPEVKAPELTEREKMYASAEESRRADLRKEGVKIPAEDDLSEGTVDGEGGEKTLETEEETDQPKKIEVKIDGQDSEVTPDEINEKLGTEGEVTPERVVEYQKHVTADKRLEDVADQRKVNEAQEEANRTKAAELAQREAELAVLRNTEAGSAPAEIDPEQVRKLGDAFLIEDHEDATKILGEIISSARGPETAQAQNISTEDLNQAALNASVTLKRNENLEEGRETLRNDYGHLLADPALQAAVDSQAAEIFKQDNKRMPGDILVDAAKAVQATILKATGQEEKKGEDERLNRKKEAAGHAAPDAGTKVAETPKPPASPSNKATVASMVENRNAGLAGRPQP